MSTSTFAIYDAGDQHLGDDGPDAETVVAGYNDVVTTGPRAKYAVPADDSTQEHHG